MFATGNRYRPGQIADQMGRSSAIDNFPQLQPMLIGELLLPVDIENFPIERRAGEFTRVFLQQAACVSVHSVAYLMDHIQSWIGPSQI